MSINQFCRQNPVTATAQETVRVAAQRMADRDVGSLAIVDENGRPVGMLTDRDIVQRVIRRRRSPDEVLIGDVMSLDVVSVWHGLPMQRAFARMRQEGVRRILVTTDDGTLSGILTYDDALPNIAKRFGLAADVLSSQYPDSGNA
jgi:CBS domain-containing protein